MRVKALTFRTADGGAINVYVGIIDGFLYGSSMVFRIEDVEVKGYRKRNSVYISHDVNDRYEYRTLDTDGRERYMLAEFLKWITPEQAKQAIYNAYEHIRPDTSLIDEVAASRDK
jgi:hypothetical protein